MKREIKLKAWHLRSKRFMDGRDFGIQAEHHDPRCLLNDREHYQTFAIRPHEEIVWTQSTGVKDKNGVEICFGDLLEVKFLAYDKVMPVRAYYEVRQAWLGNIELRIRKLFEPDELIDFLTLDADILRDDYVNQHFDRLAIRERWDERRNIQRTTTQRNEYSNDIAIVGNIYENPELLS